MYETNDKKSFRAKIDFSYDGKNRKVRRVGVAKLDDKYDNIDSLLFFNEDIEYKYSENEKKCVKNKIGFKWENFEDLNIPESAKFYSDLSFGRIEFLLVKLLIKKIIFYD